MSSHVTAIHQRALFSWKWPGQGKCRINFLFCFACGCDSFLWIYLYLNQQDLWLFNFLTHLTRERWSGCCVVLPCKLELNHNTLRPSLMHKKKINWHNHKAAFSSLGFSYISLVAKQETHLFSSQGRQGYKEWMFYIFPPLCWLFVVISEWPCLTHRAQRCYMSYSDYNSVSPWIIGVSLYGTCLLGVWLFLDLRVF